MNKKAGEKKSIITRIAEEITSGGIEVTIKEDKPAPEKKEN